MIRRILYCVLAGTFIALTLACCVPADTTRSKPSETVRANFAVSPNVPLQQEKASDQSRQKTEVEPAPQTPAFRPVTVREAYDFFQLCKASPKAIADDFRHKSIWIRGVAEFRKPQFSTDPGILNFLGDDGAVLARFQISGPTIAEFSEAFATDSVLYLIAKGKLERCPNNAVEPFPYFVNGEIGDESDVEPNPDAQRQPIAPRTSRGLQASQDQGPSRMPYVPSSPSGGVQVRGYTRADGTYVRPHVRSRPGSGGKRK